MAEDVDLSLHEDGEVLDEEVDVGLRVGSLRLLHYEVKEVYGVPQTLQVLEVEGDILDLRENIGALSERSEDVLHNVYQDGLCLLAYGCLGDDLVNPEVVGIEVDEGLHGFL